MDGLLLMTLPEYLYPISRPVISGQAPFNNSNPVAIITLPV